MCGGFGTRRKIIIFIVAMRHTDIFVKMAIPRKNITYMGCIADTFLIVPCVGDILPMFSR